MPELAGPLASGADGAGDGRAYLIVLRHVLVAQDMALTIAEVDPGARVLLAGGVAEGLAMVEGVGRIAVAFVRETPEGFAGSELARAVADRGGRAVLMGEEAEEHGEADGFAVLARPFSSGSLMHHLAGAARAGWDGGRGATASP